jgi:glucose/arabinose dehydrogenase
MSASIVHVAVMVLLILGAAGNGAVLQLAEAQSESAGDCRLLTETGRYLCEPFLSMWELNGGIAAFGFPITDPFRQYDEARTEQIVVQYFERQRMEYHRERAGTLYQVTLGRIGVDALRSQGRDWRSFPVADQESLNYFPETRHIIDPLFHDFWTRHGLELGDPGISFRESLALFGYPISELTIETNSSGDQVVVQWYERARLEFHPSNDLESRVLTGRLGAELGIEEPSPAVALKLVADGLGSPVALVPAADDSGRLFIVDRIGLIRVLTKDGVLLDEPFIDVRDRMAVLDPGFDERGLLGFAFHPEFPDNGLFYVHYSAPLRIGAPGGWNHTARIAEFRVSEDDPSKADLTSERIIMQVDEPHWAHNGGTLVFGPDGYLYIGLGDGGHGGDVGLGHVEDWYAPNRGGNGQDVEANLLGSILRIDVNAEDGYGIPADNPFVNRAGLDEIWAFGFRNPYRISFDLAGEHALFVADVGQDRWEEVNIVQAGGNYGWNVKEGSHCYYNALEEGAPVPACPDHDADGNVLIDPIIEFSNSGAPEGGLGRAVIGGFVYRGDDIVELYGKYLFGSWSQDWFDPGGRILIARRPSGAGVRWELQTLQVDQAPDGLLNHYLLGFGQDHDGELYVLTSDALGPTGTSGRVYRLTASDLIAGG